MRMSRQPNPPSAQSEKLSFTLWLNSARDEKILSASPDALAVQYPRVGRAEVARELHDRQADIRLRIEREALARPI